MHQSSEKIIWIVIHLLNFVISSLEREVLWLLAILALLFWMERDMLGFKDPLHLDVVSILVRTAQMSFSLFLLIPLGFVLLKFPTESVLLLIRTFGQSSPPVDSSLEGWLDNFLERIIWQLERIGSYCSTSLLVVFLLGFLRDSTDLFLCP